MTVPALRPYQTRAIAELREALRSCPRRSAVLASPTGSGKTTIAAEMVRSAVDRGKAVLWLVHRRELVEQARARLVQFGLLPGVIQAGTQPMPGPLQVASIQTLARRERPPADLVVVDESHHCTAAATYAKILTAYRASGSWTVGLTATPYRLDGRGLGEHFDRIVRVATPRELVELGYLVPARIWSHPCDLKGMRRRAGDYRPEDLETYARRPKLLGDLVATYRKVANGLPAVAYGVSIDHSRSIAASFNAAGIPAGHIDGGTPREEREEALARLKDGRILVLANCMILTEGIDVPHLGAVLIARPTLSRGLYLQMVGRALRPAPGKDAARILDHAGCYDRHGDPLADEEYSLAGVVAPKREREAAPRTCPQCYRVCMPGATRCEECGYVWPVRPYVIEEEAGELQERTDGGRKQEPIRAAVPYLRALLARGLPRPMVLRLFRQRAGREATQEEVAAASPQGRAAMWRRVP